MIQRPLRDPGPLKPARLYRLATVAYAFFIIVVLSLLLLGCQPDPAVVIATNTPRPPAVSIVTSTPVPTDTLTATATLTLTPSLTLTASPMTPSHTPTATYTFTPSATPTATFTATATFTWTPEATRPRRASLTPVPSLRPLGSLPEPHLWLARPIGEDGINYIERNYTYGNTQNGSMRPHHGVEFYTPAGTPIYAAADGLIVFAGSDTGSTSVSPQSNFYGNLVAIRLAQTLGGQPVFLVHGHMSAVSVEPGQFVHTGDLIGRVGGTGAALGGPHLHFEVRVGYNDYLSTRNPELWIRPFAQWGTLVGRVVDAQGRLVPLAAVAVRPVRVEGDQFVSRYLTTYASETVNPDPVYGENFVVMDLPPGSYEVQVGTTKTYKQTVAIRPNEISWIEFRDVNPPPTWTATPTGTLTVSPEATATATATGDPSGTPPAAGDSLTPTP
jgi:murein DD-endopeptidase MepM/ murein hydrolase activator NlpD